MGKKQASKTEQPVLTVKVDFLELTVPATRLYEILDLLGGLEPLDRGWRGYTCSGLVAGGLGRLGWNDDPQRAAAMGVHCSLGSQALAHLAGADARWADLSGVLQLVRVAWGGHVTRLDLAWDDKTDQGRGLLDLENMQKALEQGDYTSRWSGGRTVKGWGREEGGHTLYLGSPHSDASLRCYDKRAERLAKGHADEVDGVSHWVRVELQLRRERADSAAAELQTAQADQGRVNRFLAGVLRGYIDFKERSETDSNKRRWPVAPWWAAFLGFVEKARLVVEKVQRTIEHVKAWLGRAVGPSLALVERVMGKDQGWAFLFDVADQGRERWGPRHRAILQASGV